MRKTVAIVVAVVVAVLAVVSAAALGSPVAWAAAAVLVVVTAAVVAVVTLTPTLQRVLVGLGGVLGLVAIVVAVAEFGVRGFRTDSTAALLGVAAGLGGLLVVAGVAAGRSAPRPAALWGAAAVLAALGLVAGVVVAATVPFLPLSRAVGYTTADAATEVTLSTPAGVQDGDVMVAQVFRSGAGEIRPPAGWTALRTTALPGGVGSVSLFTSTAQGATGPVTFTSDTPATLLGGIGAWSHVAAVAAPGETTGAGGAVTAAPAPADSATQVLYFVAGTNVADIVPPEPLADAWTVKADDRVKATTALVVRPALDADPAAPVSVTPSAPLGAWAVQTVVLTAE
ncbi:hypothetical protein [Actinomycetospora termitidis]|uniref:Uncharacterized protein n=1 Tax=Actinomycetospora termitidis TaxID=3053470 RepID=A0ABT7M568_9PSEU|nr:hypothetical protein [Actinomycetospora sp. Odt1-22]MDL5155828.1 hypothetical protein [Actinomycetospora sp. Odt1-22]